MAAKQLKAFLVRSGPVGICSRMVGNPETGPGCCTLPYNALLADVDSPVRRTGGSAEITRVKADATLAVV
ncbi:MAG TPA: hypothetical protein VHZ55_13830 [Bryobacteraceae bacterium]|nr:hypothetical protein [Bryobacteraceae bacterium]